MTARAVMSAEDISIAQNQFTSSAVRAELLVGSSLKRRDQALPESSVKEAWDTCDGGTFNVRSKDYVQTKRKICSGRPLYDLTAVDVFSFVSKEYHIARRIRLPHVPMREDGLPQFLIVNIQLPTYPASMFSRSGDGPGHSIVYCFQLPPDFNPSKHENPAAIGLLQRFIQDGVEADGSPTRSRLKLIPRVVNAEEWAKAGPLNMAELKLLKTYNGTPVLQHPLTAFFEGPNYLEVDLDIHNYNFLFRRASLGYYGRLDSLVWENAFVLQGNCVDELPEQLLGCVRMFRVDFTRPRPLAAFLPRWSIDKPAWRADADAAKHGVSLLLHADSHLHNRQPQTA